LRERWVSDHPELKFGWVWTSACSPPPSSTAAWREDYLRFFNGYSLWAVHVVGEWERERVCFWEERGGVFLGLSWVPSSVQLDPTRAINKGEWANKNEEIGRLKVFGPLYMHPCKKKN
jgi:hypothetical protein